MHSLKEIINGISLTFLPGALIFFIVTAIIFYQKDKIYRYPSAGWLNIKKYPIPQDIRGFLGTDGKKVEYIYSVRWGPYGEVIFNEYDKTYLTHWQALPEPPEKE